jgi:hypothetical protein
MLDFAQCPPTWDRRSNRLQSLRQAESRLTLYTGFGRKNERLPVLCGFSNEQRTMAPLPREDIEFKTFSRVTLRGWLYSAEKRGPGIILSAGVCDNSCPNSNGDLQS